MQSTATSGLTRLDRLADVARHLDAQRLSGDADHLRGIPADLLRVDVDGGNKRKSLPFNDLSRDTRTDRTEAYDDNPYGHTKSREMGDAAREGETGRKP